VQRGLGHELPELAVWTKPVEDQEPSAGHRHVTQAMPRLVGPLRALREGHIDQQHLVEIDRRVLEEDRAFQRSDLEVEIAVGCSERGGLGREFVQLRQFAPEVRRLVEAGFQPASQGGILPPGWEAGLTGSQGWLPPRFLV